MMIGSQHDSSGNTCPSSGYIMAAVGSIIPSQTTSPKTWSTCSESYITTLVQKFAGTVSDCMANTPR
jgi:hypothetical protein